MPRSELTAPSSPDVAKTDLEQSGPEEQEYREARPERQNAISVDRLLQNVDPVCEGQSKGEGSEKGGKA